MIIQHNVPAMNANRMMGINTSNVTKSLEKLSSGYRINRAGDDAAGLAISEKMRNQIRGLDQASRNAQDGISLIQTAEGALNSTHEMLKRIREIADQSANGTNTQEERDAMQREVNQLLEEITSTAEKTEFNTMKLINGNLAGPAGGSTNGLTITGAQVVRIDAATKTTAVAAGGIAAAAFTVEDLVIDGQKLTVDWTTLSSEDQAAVIGGFATGASDKATKAAAAIIENHINGAIDNSGLTLNHVSVVSTAAGSVTVTSGLENDIRSSLESSTTGGVVDVMLGAAVQAGTNTYTGKVLTTADKFDISINGTKYSVTGIAADPATPTTIGDIATALQTAIEDAVKAYNTALGATASDKGTGAADGINIADLKVGYTNDGRIQITNNTGKDIAFFDQLGSANNPAKELGISDAITGGGAGGGMTLQVGANKGQTMTFGIGDMRAAALGVAGLKVSSQSSAADALKTADTAIRKVSEQRSVLGAAQNRLEYTVANLNTTSENLTESESRIRDTDMAKQMMKFTKDNILTQAAQAMLAQANQQPQNVLQLLR